MGVNGMHAVDNPNAAFLSSRATEGVSSVVGVIVDGNRPLMGEVQVSGRGPWLWARPRPRGRSPHAAHCPFHPFRTRASGVVAAPVTVHPCIHACPSVRPSARPSVW